MTLSDGAKADLAFSENHASLGTGCTSHRRDVVDTLHAPFYGPSIDRLFHHGNGTLAIARKLQRKQEKEVKRGRKKERTKHFPLQQRYESYGTGCGGCPPGRSSWREMDLAFRTNWTPLFFEFIDSIGMIPAPLCLLARLRNVRRYNLNESPVEFLFRKKENRPRLHRI